MRVIYADSLLFINLAINYVILLMTAKICAAQIRRLRLALAALLGALYALAAAVYEPGFLLSVWIKLAVAVLMVLTAFGGGRGIFRLSLAFLGLSAAFAGFAFAASLLSGAVSSDGSTVLPIDLRILFLSFALCYAIFSLVFKRIASKNERKTVKARVTSDRRSAQFEVLVDTGNAVSDPVSNLPILVAERDAVMSLLPQEVKTALRESGSPVEVLERLADTGHNRLFRLIPYSSVGVESGMLLAFRPDSVVIDGKKRNMLVALSPTRVSGGGLYSGLVGVLD